MKSVWIAALSLVLIACQGNTQEKAQMKTSVDSVSYSIGIDIGKNLKSQSIDINPAVLAEGLKDVLAGGKNALTDQQLEDIMTRFRKDLMAKQQEKAQALGEKNKKEGEAFLAANKTKEGVKTTASGLQYKILKAGTGAKPEATQSVTINYKGTFIDGTEFDSSFKRGQPATLAVSGFSKGFAEALQLMPVGSKYQLFIPSELAYGERGGQMIPPNSTLIFEVEMLSINK
jgi:FKBP-type peptidyl-prolyl cis-trans isomerase FklB